MAAKPGSRSLLESLLASRQAMEAQPKAAPFNFSDFAAQGNKAAQDAAFGLTDFIGGEAERLKDNWIGLKDIAGGLQKQSSLEDALASLGTGPARVGQGWTNPELSTQREGLGQMAGGALDASMLAPALPMVGKGVKAAARALEAVPVAKSAAPQLNMGFGFGGSDDSPSILNRLIDGLRGKKGEAAINADPDLFALQARVNNPFSDPAKMAAQAGARGDEAFARIKPQAWPDGFTPPTSIDDIGAGYAPAGPRADTGPLDPMDAFHPGADMSSGTAPVPYVEGQGFQGLDAKFAQSKNAATLSDALAKARGPQKPLGYDDWAPEWRAAHDKGLDMSTEARMARAKEQGFAGPFYHGTRTDFPAFAENQYFSADPEIAGSAAGSWGGRSAIPGSIPEGGQPAGPQVMPVMLRSKNPFHANPSDPLSYDIGDMSVDAGMRRKLAARGHDAAFDDKEAFMPDPANIRSTAAAFDPANIGKPNLLGMGPAAIDSPLARLLAEYGLWGAYGTGAAIGSHELAKTQQPMR